MAESTSTVSYEDLASIEEEFEEIDMEIVRKQYELSKPAYAKRAALISEIPLFWPLVLEQAPLEVDQYIQPQDSRIIAESLINVEVRRPELDTQGPGSPRSIHFKFEFKANDDFEDTVLEKTFWYRRAKDGWIGLVSEPVRIHWKTGKDLTQGLTDGARALFEARAKLGDMTAKGLPEYTALKKKVDSWNGMNTSLFTWFGWISNRRWVSQEENEEAVREQASLKQRRKMGEEVEPPEEDDDADDEAVEVHQAGEELAIAFAEDLWPNAIKYFTQAQESNEMDDMEDDDLESESAEDDDDEDQPIDIRSLVQDKDSRNRSSNGDGPASKKRRF